MWLDWTIVGIIIISAVISITRGFIKEMLSLIVWIIAFLVATKFYINLSKLILAYISNESISYLISFILLLIGSLLVGGIINFYLNKLFKKTGLSVMDRLLGVAFGIIRGAAIILAIVIIVEHTPMRENLIWKNSIMVAHFNNISINILNILADKKTTQLTI